MISTGWVNCCSDRNTVVSGYSFWASLLCQIYNCGIPCRLLALVKAFEWLTLQAGSITSTEVSPCVRFLSVTRVVQLLGVSAALCRRCARMILRPTLSALSLARHRG